MADIFLSYASEDRQRIAPLARLLEGCGWSVFWDRKTPIGVTWDEYITTNLEVSRCVVVAWSNTSVKSKWVRSEGRYGLNREACVPLFLERVQPPFPFDQTGRQRSRAGAQARSEGGYCGGQQVGPALSGGQDETCQPVVKTEKLAVCIGCGCDDLHACMRSIEPCHWLRVDRDAGLGVCSVCPGLVVNWDAGERGER